MNIFDGLSSFAHQAYDAASSAAGAAAGAASAAASSLYNYASPYLPGQSGSGSSSGVDASASTSKPGHYVPADELRRMAQQQAQVSDVEGEDSDAESVADDAEPNNIDPNAQGHAHGQHADGWSPYKPLPRNTTIGTAFDYLRKDFHYTLEGKMKHHLEKLKELETENNLLDTLLTKILEKTESQQNSLDAAHKGGFDCTDDAELTQLLENGRNSGLNIPNKTQFTKSEKDLLIRELERKGRDLEKKLKDQAQKIDEAKAMTNQVYEMLKSLADKINSLISKICQAIK